MKHLFKLVISLALVLSCTSDDNIQPIENQAQDEIPDGEDPLFTGFTPCESGLAGDFPCQDIDLQSFMPLSTLDALRGNDSWGWADPATGNEYALMGLDNGTAFVDITNPNHPVYLGKLPAHSAPSNWRDIKTSGSYAYIVSEASGHGMQVFDLTRLRSVTSPPQTFTEDAHLDGFGSAHNIVINPNSDYAYVVGADNFEGGPIFVNIQDPLNPVIEGGYSAGNYSHDAQVVTYAGPDKDHTGKEIFIGSNENELVIADITDKAAPVTLATVNYSNIGYTHQGWFTEDQRYFIVGDELDELEVGFKTRTLIFDFEDLDNPSFMTSYFGPTFAIDHNGYVKEELYYLANYTAGIRIIDISGIDSGSLSESAFFDTFPDHDDANFHGVWSVYPFLPSGNIIVSDINLGLFVVKPR